MFRAIYGTRAKQYFSISNYIAQFRPAKSKLRFFHILIKFFFTGGFYNVSVSLSFSALDTTAWPLITSTDKPENFSHSTAYPKHCFRNHDSRTCQPMLYGILLDRRGLSAKNGWLDEQNRVFIIFTIEDVKRALCCADNKATKLLRELEKFGLIERKRRGQGKPCLVYVKNFSAESSK